MKKLSLILAMMIGLSAFASCGDTDDSKGSKKSSSSSSPKYEQNDDKDEDNAANDKDSDKDNKNSDVKDKDNDKEKETEEKTKEKTEEKEDDDKESSESNFKKGVVNGNSYKSEYNKIKIDLNDEWQVLTEDEMLETMNIGLEASGGDAATADLLKQLVIYEFVASNQSTGETIMVMYENIARKVLNPDTFTVADYIEAAKKNVDASMPNADVTWSDKSEKIEIAGQEFEKYVVNIDLESYGLSVTQDYCIKKLDDFIFVINYSSGTAEKTINDYIDCFSELK